MESQATILVVDDSPENLQVISAVLKEHYKVKVAINGERALTLATAAEPPDLILLDVMMPGMDGTETLAALRELEATRSTPVVFLTAKAQPTEVQRLLELGARDVLTKPFDPLTIADRLAGILDD
jgi:putative two-component system response regulator